MSEGKERAEARLSNLKGIEPLLGSLRVLSLSTMQMALNRQASLSAYAERFSLVAAQVRSQAGDKPKKHEAEEHFDHQPVEQYQVLAVLGSSRGICGQYNKQLARMASERLERKDGLPTKVLAFGVRVQLALTHEGVRFEGHETLGLGSTPAYDQAAHWLRGWTAALQDSTLAKVEILSFRKRSPGNNYNPVFTTLLPEGNDDVEGDESEQLPWPPPIIEGDPERMLKQIDRHLLAIRFYQLILDAIAAENLYRYRLLEEAKENTSDLIEELALAIQSERRKEITQQLQELLVGSGMLAQR
ncbi:MAG: FoF1 ATP synthase subunit gamma [Anaerolineaceae bacterium]